MTDTEFTRAAEPNQSKYHEIEQPEDLSTREKEDAMGAYLMMFAAWGAGLPLPLLNLLAAIIYYYVNASKSRFVKFHSLQSVWSQLPTTLLNAGLVFWFWRNLIYENDFDRMFWAYLGMVAVANILYIVFSLVAAFKAKKGRFYYFIFFGRLSYHFAYFRRPEDELPRSSNQPPPM